MKVPSGTRVQYEGDIRRYQRMLGLYGEEFEYESILCSDPGEVLRGVRGSMSILRSLSKYVGACGGDVSRYRELMRAMDDVRVGRVVGELDVEYVYECLGRNVRDESVLSGVRLLSYILLNGDARLYEISVSDMVRTCGSGSIYVDVDVCRWYVGYRVYDLAGELCEYVCDQIRRYGCLCVDGGGCMYRDGTSGSKSISRGFKNSVGGRWTYGDLQRLLVGRKRVSVVRRVVVDVESVKGDSSIVEIDGNLIAERCGNGQSIECSIPESDGNIIPESDKIIPQCDGNPIPESDGNGQSIECSIPESDGNPIPDSDGNGQSIECSMPQCDGNPIPDSDGNGQSIECSIPESDGNPIPESDGNPVSERDSNGHSIGDIRKRIVVRRREPGNIRCIEYDWSYFDRERSDYIHIRNVRTVMRGMYGEDARFCHGKLDSEGGLRLYKEYIDGLSSYNTRVNYCNSVCKILELCVSNLYGSYVIYRDEKRLELSKHNASRSVVNFVDILDKVRGVRDGEVKVGSGVRSYKAVRVMCLLICEQIEEGMTGVLRFSDLSRCKLKDDGESNYLDVDGLRMTMRSGSTKNKCDRVMSVSAGFVSGLRLIYGDYPSSVLCYDDMSEMCDTRVISRDFKSLVGVLYTDIRSSFTTYMCEHCNDVSRLREICKNQGHSARVAMVEYRRKPK